MFTSLGAFLELFRVSKLPKKISRISSINMAGRRKEGGEIVC